MRCIKVASFSGLGQLMGGVTETTICVGSEGLRPLQIPVNGGYPPLKFPPYLLFRPKGGRKSSNFFSHFRGLVPDINYESFHSRIMVFSK